ncbi:uncharacterized protein [Antedon mediterranea]|uniref:uncharacterized protein n=1 Tax=Antedon mediterranea TaxID=105859 RepID=UPI003AF73C48
MTVTLFFLLFAVNIAWGCNPSSTQTTTASPTEAVVASDVSTVIQEDRVSFSVGEVEFIDLMCGIPWNKRLRRSLPNPNEDPTKRGPPPNPIDELRLTHSMLTFRGKVFEWGVLPLSPISRNFGWMNRKSESKCISWDVAPRGTSRCSLEEATAWAENYHLVEGSYNLLLNNCHMFVKKMIQFLESC